MDPRKTDADARPPAATRTPRPAPLVDELTQQEQIIASWFLDTGSDPREFAVPTALDAWRFAA